MTYKIILIRHGESLANVNPNYYYEHDSAIILSETGVQQSLNLAKSMHLFMKICGDKTKVISSMMKRAMLTADIACHTLPHTIVHRDERLNECHQVFRPGEQFESNESVRARVKGVLDAHPDTSLILFCHGELMWNLDSMKPQVRNTEFRIYNRDTFYEHHIMKSTRLIVTI